MLDRHQLAYTVTERKLTSSSHSDENVSPNQRVNVFSCPADHTANGCQQGTADEEPATTKDVRESSHKRVTDRQG